MEVDYPAFLTARKQQIHSPMSIRYDDSRGDRDVLKIPVIRVAFALSLLIHVAALWPWLPPPKFLTPGDIDPKDSPTRLQLRMAPPVAQALPPKAPPAKPRPAPAPKSVPVPKPKPAPSPAPAPPPVIAREAPGPAIQAPAPPVPVISPPKPASAPAVGDMAALIEARRRARGEPAPAAPPVAEDENVRRNRIVAENLNSNRAPAFGEERRSSGGIFQIEHLYFDSADFLFYGWNRSINRNSRQVIEVRKGDNSDIRIAVVRRMISIIREYEQEDFLWDSIVLRRTVTLSARQKDSAALEDFLLREFFPEFSRGR